MTRKLLASLAMTTALTVPALAQDRAAVLDTYADIAEAAYGDSLATAKALQEAVAALVADPSDATLAAARTAWIKARVPYQQTEVYRFGNAIVDDWEGKVNAWPLDEGLIDYVDATYGGATDENEYAALNVIATPAFTLSGEEIDAAEITPELIAETLHEADEVEANVASGYHAIEFLLWGQDLNGTEHGAGDRPWTDYAQGADCTGGNCDRRAAYLTAATELLVSDLEWMAGQWAEGGDARAAVTGDEVAGLTAMLTGMGSLSYGEQAGERMKLGVMLNDPEEEHDCFSDNTHNSHYYDGLGIRNVYFGEYVGADGTVTSGPSLSELVASIDPEVDAALRADINATMGELGQLKAAAEAGYSYDQMLARGNAGGEALIMAAVEALVNQTRSIERAVTALELDQIAVEGSDSLDNPDAVFQ
ncbi:imelysin family protein [Pseudooceanicola sp. LIPI14-2-Ac024]|uniref:imelysin family protein n=1 Tax=Pseudooceanicola sp. LIPI14-2-Ac024 TaxID=3344875 RepID=UPI0035CEE28C